MFSSTVSELRIVLLGGCDEEKSKVGNIILRREAFETQSSFFPGKQQCERARGLVDGSHVTVINTPDLLHPQITQHEIDKQVELCVSLSDPGPHVLLLVLQPNRLTEKDRDRMKRILTMLGDHDFGYTMVLITNGDIQDVCMDKQKELIAFIEECSGRYQQFDINSNDCTQITEFMKKITMVVEANEGTYLICEIYKELETDNPKQQRRSSIDMPPNLAGADRLNLVVFGRRGAGKTSAVNAILGQREFTVDPSPEYESREGEVCGRLVTVVELPALSEAQLSISTVSHLFTSLCGPGVHAFLLVMPAGSHTDEDKAEIVRIREIFGTRVADYMIVLFTDDNPAARADFDFLKQNKETRELLQTCGNRFYVFNCQEILNNPIISELLGAVEWMNKKIGSCFSLDMYLEALQKELQAKHRAELEEKDRRIFELEQNFERTAGIMGKDQSPACLRILLVGRMGSGKSATGNTILQREEFLSQSSMTSVTTSCKKGVGDVAGRHVAVVDTPGLFDVPHSNEDVQQIIAECFSLLAPGPHVFLLVLQIGRMTSAQEDTLQLIKSIFGKDVGKFIVIIFTRGDDLKNETFENYIQSGDGTIQKLIHDCGNRVHVFNNNDMNNRTQVTELLDKIDMMVQKNGGGCYTNEMFQEAELTIKKECERILREKEGEMQREREKLKAKHEEEMEEMKRRMEEQRRIEEEEQARREKELKDKEENLKKEIVAMKNRQQEANERRDEDEKRWKSQELEWKRKMDEKEQEKCRIKEELQHKEEEEKRLETVEKEREELIQKQDREKREFEEKLADEKEKRDNEEQEKRSREENERREWDQRIKEAEKDKKEIQEDMKKRAEEWEMQREKERLRTEEKWKQKEEQERKEWEEKQRKMRDEFEIEKDQERKKRERDKEIMEKDLEEKKTQLKQKEEEWEKERKEEREKRYKEDEQRREEERKRLVKQQEEFEKEREEENQRRKKEEKARREREEKERREIEEEYERKIKEIKRKYEEEARKQAQLLDEMKPRRYCTVL